jgi:hypothetical protein
LTTNRRDRASEEIAHPRGRKIRRSVTTKSDKPTKGKIRGGISFHRLGMLGDGPWREEIIVIQYDDGVSCARRNAEIEGSRFSFVLLTTPLS